MLTFGTGGVRAPVGPGRAQFNPSTVRLLTQGLAEFLLAKQPNTSPPSVIIGYDCRVDSRAFAQAAAEVLLGNGIEVYLCNALRPTPLISFGCRFFKCHAGIMITASHNPPGDNGYKVYAACGGQIAPPEDQALMQAMRKITQLEQVKQAALTSPLLHRVGTELDEAYLHVCEESALTPALNLASGGQLSIVYSNLHGTGGTLIPAILRRCGFWQLTEVASQAQPDGTFPTVATANPEDPEALQLGVETLLQVHGDLLLTSDPDADRIGVAVKDSGNVQLLSGNQVACLCLDHLCSQLQQQGRLPKRAVCMKTVVTTPLFDAIAKQYGIACIACLPGSKYMSQQIEAWEQDTNGPLFLFGAEESCGYLNGCQVREKDAVMSALLIAEAALHAKQEESTLYQKLLMLYARYGIHREASLSWRFSETQGGQAKRQEIMMRLRKKPPHVLGGRTVLKYRDFQETQSPADLLFFELEGAWAAIRPSGTEAKMKLYVGCVKEPVAYTDPDSLLDAVSRVDSELQALVRAIRMEIGEWT